jgi:hypothetical protein
MSAEELCLNFLIEIMKLRKYKLRSFEQDLTITEKILDTLFELDGEINVKHGIDKCLRSLDLMDTLALQEVYFDEAFIDKGYQEVVLSNFSIMFEDIFNAYIEVMKREVLPTDKTAENVDEVVLVNEPEEGESETSD